MPIRITGMGSGLDIDKLVTDLMKAERIPLDKLKQKKTSVGWKSDLYREVNTKLTELRKALDKIRLQGDWKDSKATSSNDNVVSATAKAGISTGSHSIEVKELALSATKSGTITPTSGNPPYTTALSSELGKLIPGLTDGDIQINGIPVSYKSTDTLKDFMNKVQSKVPDVKTEYNELTGEFSIKTVKTGSSAKVNVTDGTGDLSSRIGIISGEVTGSNAEVKIDGLPTSSYLKSESNTLSVNGITYTINAKGSATVTVSGNNDDMVKQITEFADTYNSTIELLNQRTKERKVRGFDPLTDDQKSDMKEADIKNWEEKAKSGLISNDQILKSALSGLRSIVNNSVSSVPQGMNALFKIGISTMPYNSASPNDSGKLVIDEEKLRKAISEDAGAVVGLFTDQDSGIASEMYKQVDKSIKELVDKAGGVGSPAESIMTTLGQRMTGINKQIASFSDKLARKEEYYYKMFAAMDSAVGKNNAQLNWLMQNGG